MNNQNFNQNELDQLLNPPKSKLPLIAGILVTISVLGMIGSFIALVVFIAKSPDFQEAFEAEQYEYNDDSAYDGDLLKITPEQAKTWIGENFTEMNSLESMVEKEPSLRSLWLASESTAAYDNTFAWINEVNCTADTAAVNEEDGVFLFSDFVSNLGVSITNFYAIIDKMRSINIEGYELYKDGNDKVLGIDFYHREYDGSFYYAVDGDEPVGGGYKLQDNWWFTDG